ncbi:SDR family oxidoreductase [Glaciecola sp. 1036]|uniref:SDR family oxidoreductase n=1 Tax=Alteromonadaceae TaxID=72275 RepID=UPI003D03FC0C
MSKIVLITGASSGFGRDTACTLSAKGFTVFASMRDIAGKNKASADALMQQGINVVELDVTDTSSIDKAVAQIIQQTGRIDVLINNAGVASAGVSEAFTDEQVQALFDVNVIGLHRVTRAVLPNMRDNKNGLIINIGSILGRVTFPFFGLYGASKFAVEAISDSLGYELSQFGVDVTLVQPSAFPTQMYASADQPEDLMRVVDYGDVGKIPTNMFSHFMQLFESEDSPNPHDVSEAITKVVQLPKGTRPARLVVGGSFGADVINDATAPVQYATVKALGLEHLDPQNKTAKEIA